MRTSIFKNLRFFDASIELERAKSGLIRVRCIVRVCANGPKKRVAELCSVFLWSGALMLRVHCALARARRALPAIAARSCWRLSACGGAARSMHSSLARQTAAAKLASPASEAYSPPPYGNTSTPTASNQQPTSAPELGTAYRYLSFFKYVPIEEKYLHPLQQLLKKEWAKLGVLGRIYIGDEGQLRWSSCSVFGWK
jgi:hypothetical protein